MKFFVVSIVLIPIILATNEESNARTLTNFDSRPSPIEQGKHDRDHRRQIKVTVEKTVDDDSTSGYNTKTVTKERTVDDDNADGLVVKKSASSTKTKYTANSPSDAASDISADEASSALTTETRSSSSKHHNNDTITGDAMLSGEGSEDGVGNDVDAPNGTTHISDIMDILNGNLDHDNSTGSDKTGGKLVLPPEHEPSEIWIVAIVTLFSSMAISLCITTAIRGCRKNNRRTGYQEVSNIVV